MDEASKLQWKLFVTTVIDAGANLRGELKGDEFFMHKERWVNVKTDQLMGMVQAYVTELGIAGLGEVAGPEFDMERLGFKKILAAQRGLYLLGYSPGPLDGIMGLRTKSVVTQYQSANSVGKLGVLDQPTRESIAKHVLEACKGMAE